MYVLKPGATIGGFEQEIKDALMIAGLVWSHVLHRGALVVTSGTDSDHGPRSFHYNGLAVDIRSHDLSDEDKTRAAEAMRRILFQFDSRFSFILEDKDQPNEHFHLQFRKGEPGVRR